MEQIAVMACVGHSWGVAGKTIPSLQRMRRRARTDANHASIVQALRSVGWIVEDTSRLGSGFPDLVAARQGVLRLIEVKDGTKRPSARRRTAAEYEFAQRMSSACVEVRVVSSIEEALAL